MRRFLFISFLLYCGFANAQSLSNVRLLYKDATKSEEQAEAFYEPLTAVTKSDKPIWVAYKGSGLMLLARYTKLSERRSKIKEAVEWIEQAVEQEPNNAEIRLIRLSVQENLPKFLKYNQNITEDKAFIEEAMPKITDEGLKAMINGYFEEFSK